LDENEEVELIILRSEPEPQPQKFADAWEYLQSLSPIERTPEQWEPIEREFRE